MFFEKLQKLCKNKGVSVSQMCLDLGFAKSTASRWKSGYSNVTNKNLKLIADYFGVPVSYFTEDDSVPAPASPRDETVRRLVRYIEKLPDDRLAAVEDLLRMLADK